MQFIVLFIISLIYFMSLKYQEATLTLTKGVVIEIVLYLNGVLHETRQEESWMLNVITLCEYIIDLCVPQTNL